MLGCAAEASWPAAAAVGCPLACARPPPPDVVQELAVVKAVVVGRVALCGREAEGGQAQLVSRAAGASGSSREQAKRRRTGVVGGGERRGLVPIDGIVPAPRRWRAGQRACQAYAQASWWAPVAGIARNETSTHLKKYLTFSAITAGGCRSRHCARRALQRHQPSAGGQEGGRAAERAELPARAPLAAPTAAART